MKKLSLSLLALGSLISNNASSPVSQLRAGPTFFMSVLVERYFYRRSLQDLAPAANFSKTSWIIHLASYGFLFALGFILLIYALLSHTPKV